jgi:hypothetical protein
MLRRAALLQAVAHEAQEVVNLFVCQGVFEGRHSVSAVVNLREQALVGVRGGAPSRKEGALSVPISRPSPSWPWHTAQLRWKSSSAGSAAFAFVLSRGAHDADESATSAAASASLKVFARRFPSRPVSLRDCILRRDDKPDCCRPQT